MDLDQENLLDGSLVGQGIGRFSDGDGSPDPTGTTFDFQDAQTFTAAAAGLLATINVPVRLGFQPGATEPVVLDVREVIDGVPDPDDARILGSFSVLGENVAVVGNADPATWLTFDVSSLEVMVDVGDVVAFSVRSVDVVGYIFNPESSLGYASGAGFRRNRATTTEWSLGTDFGFQVFTIPTSNICPTP